MKRGSKGDQATSAGPAGGLSAGAMLQSFRIDRQLGRGGMGEVWRAQDTVGEREVVIKVLPPELQGNQAELTRVKDTFRRIHALQHQHICPTYALGQDPRVGYYLVMKYIDGMELKEFAQSRGPLPLAEVVAVLQPVASALDYAHSQKVVHRDVKTENIMVGRDGSNPQLVDFGVASEIRTSLARVSNVRMDASGTRPYMAPEQWRGDYQDGASDQYALAVVAYELLAGRLPFVSPDTAVLRQCVLNDSPPRIDGQPPAVHAALLRGMAKERTARFPSCSQFIAELARPTSGAAPPLMSPGRSAGRPGAPPPMLKPPVRPGGAGSGPAGSGPAGSGLAGSGPLPAAPPPMVPSLPLSRRITAWMRSVETRFGFTPQNRWQLWAGAATLLVVLLIGAAILAGVFSQRRFHIGDARRAVPAPLGPTLSPDPRTVRHSTA